MINWSAIAGCKVANPEGDVLTLSCVPILLANIIFWLIILAGTVSLFFIIFSGIKFLTSQGDSSKVDSARKTLTWAIVGLCLVLISFGILNFVSDLTGLACIKNFGFTNCTAP